MTRSLALLSEEEYRLVRQAKSADGEAAFTVLVKRYQGMVRAFLFRLCSSGCLADDIGQETFILAHRKLPSFRGDSTFSTWLFAIAYRCYLMEMRRLKSEKEKTFVFAKEAEINPGYYETISPEQLDMEIAIAKLDNSEIAAITLCFSVGCSHSEAAKILGIPLGTVKTHINNGKAKLRSLLVLESEGKVEKR